MDFFLASAVVARFLEPCFQEDELDLIPNEDTGELEIMTDDWTLHVECRPHGLAWLAVDTEPRVVDVPEDLAAALAAADSADAFGALSYSRQKAHVTAVLGAKAPETRARRVAKVVSDLTG